MAKSAIRFEIDTQDDDPSAYDRGRGGAGSNESDRLIAANPFGNPSQVMESETEARHQLRHAAPIDLHARHRTLPHCAPDDTERS
jgi:hypothetical protein